MGNLILCHADGFTLTIGQFHVTIRKKALNGERDGLTRKRQVKRVACGEVCTVNPTLVLTLVGLKLLLGLMLHKCLRGHRLTHLPNILVGHLGGLGLAILASIRHVDRAILVVKVTTLMIDGNAVYQLNRNNLTLLVLIRPNILLCLLRECCGLLADSLIDATQGLCGGIESSHCIRLGLIQSLTVSRKESIGLTTLYGLVGFSQQVLVVTKHTGHAGLG